MSRFDEVEHVPDMADLELALKIRLRFAVLLRVKDVLGGGDLGLVFVPRGRFPWC